MSKMLPDDFVHTIAQCCLHGAGVRQMMKLRGVSQDFRRSVDQHVLRVMKDEDSGKTYIYKDLQAEVLQLQEATIQRIVLFEWATFSPPDTSVGGLSIVLCAPEKADGDLLNAEQLKGKLAVAHRGGCSFQDKAERVESAGARGLVIVNNTDALLAAGATTKGYCAEIPVVTIRAKDAAALLTAADSSCLYPYHGDRDVQLQCAINLAVHWIALACVSFAREECTKRCIRSFKLCMRSFMYTVAWNRSIELMMNLKQEHGLQLVEMATSRLATVMPGLSEEEIRKALALAFRNCCKRDDEGTTRKR